MQNTRLDEAQPGIKTAGRNINNLRYSGDTTLMAKNKEKLKDLLSSIIQSCPTLCDPMDYSLPCSSQLQELKFMYIQSVMPSSHLILCSPVLLLPSIFCSINSFSSESVLPNRWSKYWSFSFSISYSSECSELISFRINLKSLLMKVKEESERGK